LDIEHYRARLLEMERRLAERVERAVVTAREVTVEDDTINPGDQTVADELADELLSEAERQSRTLRQVRDALQRIEDGSFGRCVVDGKPIDEKRLEATPWTPYCLTHQQELEERRLSRTPTL
jgi:DnaK suppressor protein